jgi:CBS domain-containing protein
MPRRYEDDEREGRSIFEEGAIFFVDTGAVRGAARRNALARPLPRHHDARRNGRHARHDARRCGASDEERGHGRHPRRGSHRDERRAGSDAGAGNVLDTLAGTTSEARRINATIHGNGRLVGLITDRDIVIRAIAEGRDAAHHARRRDHDGRGAHAHPNDRVIEAIRKMGDKQVRRIPIVDQERTLRGIISMADVALETNDDRELAEALEEISSGSSFWNRIFG